MARVVAQRLRVRDFLAVATAGLVIDVAVLNRTTLEAASGSIVRADHEWLVLAAVLTVLIWVAGTVTQLGSMPARPPVWRLFAVQVAASFANHLLPAGSGGMAVNVRFLERHGMSRGNAVGAVTLNALAGAVMHLALLVVAILAAPTAVHSTEQQLRSQGIVRRLPVDLTSPSNQLWLIVAGAVLGVAVVAVVLGRRSRPARWLGAQCRAVRGRVAAEVAVLVEVVRDPARAAKLWLGSLAVPLLHCLVLVAVLRSLDNRAPTATLVIVYLVASSLAALLPSPGGLGALDLALLAGLVAVGLPSPTAAGAVLAYRLLTVWLPLVPSAVVFATLVRRRVI